MGGWSCSASSVKVWWLAPSTVTMKRGRVEEGRDHAGLLALAAPRLPTRPRCATLPHPRRLDMSGNGTEESPWTLTTPPGSSEFQAWLDHDSDPPTIKVQVGKTWLRYRMPAIEDLYAMLVAHGDWMLLGNSDEGKTPKPDSVEAWGRSADNPAGGWYGIRKGYRGRFANYITPILALQGRVEFEKRGAAWWVRAI